MKKHILATVIAAASIGNVYAESLLDVYKLAQDHDPSLRSAAATYEAQKEEVTITKGNLFPDITFNGNLGYNNTDSPTFDGHRTSNSLSLDMNYPIYSPALGYAVDAVEINFDSAAIDYENAKENLALQSLTEYFDLLTAQATLKNTEAQVLSNASQLDRVKKQFDVGLVSITDMQDAQAAYDAGSYEVAADAFGTFAQNYTGGFLTSEAHFMRGEALSKLGQTTEAARSYLDSFNISSDGVRAPAALLRLGGAMAALGHVDKGCVMLAEVGTRFAGAPEVGEADAARQTLGCQ
jgi:tol-pal system protein YbgF